MLLENKELTIIMISHDISDELKGKFDNIIKLWYKRKLVKNDIDWVEE